MSVSLLDLHRSWLWCTLIKCWRTFVIDRCGLTLGGQSWQLRNCYCTSQIISHMYIKYLRRSQNLYRLGNIFIIFKPKPPEYCKRQNTTKRKSVYANVKPNRGSN